MELLAFRCVGYSKEFQLHCKIWSTAQQPPHDETDEHLDCKFSCGFLQIYSHTNFELYFQSDAAWGNSQDPSLTSLVDIMWPFRAPVQIISPHHVHHLLLLGTRVKDGEMKATLHAHKHTQVNHRWRKCPLALSRLNKRRLWRHLILSIAFLLLMVWGASTHCLTHTHTHAHTTSAVLTPPGCVNTARWWNCGSRRLYPSSLKSYSSTKKSYKQKHSRHQSNSIICVSKKNTAWSWGWSVCYENSLRSGV